MRSFAIVCLGYQLLLFAALSTQAGEKKLPEQVKAVLDNASEFELYWLDPSAKANQSDASLYRWKVLGKTLIKDAMPRSHLVEAIESDIERGKEYAECFEPRHAIRASYEGKTVDLVICYRCRWMYVYVDEKRVADIVIATKSTSLFDKHYRDAEIFLQNNTSVLALSHFIGTWDTQTTLHLPKVSFGRQGEGQRTTGTISCEWAVGKRFIQAKGTNSLREELLFHWTYDRTRKAYRMWLFSAGGVSDTGGHSIDATGEWSPDAKTLVLKNEIAEGTKNTAMTAMSEFNANTFSFRVIDVDTIEFHVEAIDKDGKLAMTVESKWTRKK